MKRYLSLAVVFLFVLSLFVFNTKSTKAFLPGCSSTSGWSSVTGESCLPTPVCTNGFDPTTGFLCGCTSTSGYSSVNGLSCNPNPTSTPVCTNGYDPTTGFLCGCTSTSGYSSTNGGSCSVGTFPPGCTSNQGYSATTGLPCWTTTSGAPVISGVSGPQSLNVNQTGTWMVTAYDSNGGNLSYGVRWGDEETIAPMASSLNSQVQQSATFTHIYSHAGTYNPTFTVTNGNGQSAQTSLSVNVGGTSITPVVTIDHILPAGCTNNNGYSYLTGEPCSNNRTSANFGDTVYLYGSNFHQNFNTGAYVGTYSSTTGGLVKMFTNFISSSLVSFVVSPDAGSGNHGLVYHEGMVSTSNTVSLNFIGSTTPSITVLSPNGGEVFTEGQQIEVRWNTSNITKNVKNIGIYLMYADAENGGSGTLLPSNDLYTINDGVQTVSLPVEIFLPSGVDPRYGTRYKIGVVALTPGYGNGIISDYSDNKFTINEANTQTPSVSITSPTAGSNWTIGSTQTIHVNMVNVPNPTVAKEDIFLYSANNVAYPPVVYLQNSVIIPSYTATITTPQVPPGNYYVYARAVVGTTVYDARSKNFTIKDVAAPMKNGTVSGAATVLGAEAFSFTQLLKVGSTGNEVTELQKFLNSAGYDVGTPDGKFGLKTEAAVIKFQTDNKLEKIDGIVGPTVRALINR